MFPDDFAALDRAAGGTFPFSREQIRGRARALVGGLAGVGSVPRHGVQAESRGRRRGAARVAGLAVLRARLDAVEREKLERYQRRYEEYTRVSKALKSLGGA